MKPSPTLTPYNPAALAAANAVHAAIAREQFIARLTQMAHDGLLTREEIDAAVQAGLLPQEFSHLSLLDQARIWLACLQPNIFWGYMTNNPQTTLRGVLKAAILILAAFNVHLPDAAQTAIIEAALALWSVVEVAREILRHDSKTKQLTRFVQSPYAKGLRL